MEISKSTTTSSAKASTLESEECHLTTEDDSRKSEKETRKLATIAIKDDVEEESSACRLFISNFPFSWDQDDLRNFLKDFEPVEEIEIVYNERGSKGFGFATINDPERCRQARLVLNHKIVQGRRVEIRQAHKMKRTRSVGPVVTPNAPTVTNLINLQSFHELNNLSLLNAQLQQAQAMALQTLITPGLVNLLNNPLLALNLLQSNIQNAVMNSGRSSMMDAYKWPFLSTGSSLFSPDQGMMADMGLNPSFALPNNIDLGNYSRLLPQNGAPSLDNLLGPSYSYGFGNRNDHLNNPIFSGQSLNPFSPQINGLDRASPSSLHNAQEDRNIQESDFNDWLTEGRKRSSDSILSPIGNPRKLGRSEGNG